MYALLPEDVEDATAVSTAATLDDIASTELCCSSNAFCWFILLKKLVPPRPSEAAGRTVGPIDVAVDINAWKFKELLHRKADITLIFRRNVAFYRPIKDIYLCTSSECLKLSINSLPHSSPNFSLKRGMFYWLYVMLFFIVIQLICDIGLFSIFFSVAFGGRFNRKSWKGTSKFICIRGILIEIYKRQR